jgi:hypothetical protein
MLVCRWANLRVSESELEQARRETMSFTTAEVSDRLAELWLEADDRNNISRAVEEFDQTLARVPNAMGESRPDSTRVYLVPPVGVFFNVTGVDEIVSVLRVWTF